MKNVPTKKETKLPPELYPLCIKDVELLTEKDKSTAWRKLKELREKLDRKERRQKVFLTEFCEYYSYPLQKACEFLSIRYIGESSSDNIDSSSTSLTPKRKAS